MRHLINRGSDRLADIKGRYPASVFFLVLLMYTLALIYESLGYSADARLFPLVVGVPLAIMIVGKILLLLLQDQLDLEVAGFFEDIGTVSVSQTQKEQSRAMQYRRELSMILWIGGLMVLIYLIGNLAAVPVFIFAFIFAHERNIKRAVLAAIVSSIFIFLLFVQVLNTTLWRGVFPIAGGLV